jgi:hypothetical protein
MGRHDSAADEGIPFVLSVHVEPDPDLDTGLHGPVAWTGFAALQDHLAILRPRLEAATTSPLAVWWLLRMDRQIESLCGSGDFIAHRFAGELDALVASGGNVGLHVHASRWNQDLGRWVLDTDDPQFWLEDARVGLDAFQSAYGSAPAGFNYTRGLTSDAIRRELADRGVLVDLSPQPGPRDSRHTHGSPALVNGSGGQSLCIAPGNLGLPYHGPAGVARRVRYGRGARWNLHAYRGQEPHRFWSQIATSLSEMPFPYATLALRTSAAGGWVDDRQRLLLEALIEHPLAPRLRFMGPTQFAGELCASGYGEFNGTRRPSRPVMPSNSPRP